MVNSRHLTKLFLCKPFVGSVAQNQYEVPILPHALFETTMIVSRKNIRCENTQVLREAIAEEEEDDDDDVDDDDDDDDFLGTTADHCLLL